MDVIMNAGPDLKVSQNYGFKVLAENLPNITSEDSSTELTIKGPRASTFNTPISVAILNLLPEVYRSARLKYQPVHDNDDHYQKSSYKHEEFS